MKRQRMEQNVALAKTPRLRQELLLDREVRVGEQCALGLAGRAARIHEQGGVILFWSRSNRRSGVRYELFGQKRSPVQSGNALRQVPRDDNRLHLRVVAEVGRLRRGMERRKDDRGATRPKDSEKARNEGRSRRDENGHAFALERPAPAEQCGSDSFCAPNRVSPGGRAKGIVRHRSRVGPARKPSVQKGREQWSPRSAACRSGLIQLDDVAIGISHENRLRARRETNGPFSNGNCRCLET